jgi:hypothetical protein
VGYRVQMLAKLAIAALVETHFYVTLDAGAFESQLFPPGVS